MKAAISGFRHGHIVSLVKKLKDRPEIEITACCEDNPADCAEIIKKCEVEITHSDFGRMLREADFDILAVGDVYSRRGQQSAAAAEAGKHILSDKPLCTRMEEFNRIKKAALSGGTSVMALLSLRYTPSLRAARELVSRGKIGEITNVIVTGHHALMFGSGRPDWYFKEGMHGGTINDLMVHGIDAVRWITGMRFSEIISARTAHFEPGQAPFFQDTAAAFLGLENNAGVFIDSSYKAPAGHPSGWEFAFWGTEGSMEFASSGPITIKRHNMPPREVEPEPSGDADFLSDFLNEIGRVKGASPVLTTAECLDSTGLTLEIQSAADSGQKGVRVSG